MSASPIKWQDEGAYVGDNRRLAMVGSLAIGAIFLSAGRGARYVRWRIWCSATMNPAEGVARSIDSAKREVEDRFGKFLMLTGLVRTAP
ncbi:hypothetical protein [Nitrobacter sp.]|jgi:hypothetical protein|uniref:hypothetical protein n=1 Tax=Nitrobacter sp. TaxID=29420 RepID=UPI003F64BDAD